MSETVPLLPPRPDPEYNDSITIDLPGIPEPATVPFIQIHEEEAGVVMVSIYYDRSAIGLSGEPSQADIEKYSKYHIMVINKILDKPIKITTPVGKGHGDRA